MTIISDPKAGETGTFDLAHIDLAHIDDAPLPFRLHHIGGMMRLREIKLIYLLARHSLHHGRHIIDAGAFLGISAAAMAAGLDARPDRNEFFRSIHSYDQFINSSEFYSRFLHGVVPPQGSFLPHFLDNIEPYSKYINVYPGDFAKMDWIGRPIGLLVNDVAKSPQLDARIWLHYAPHWLAGETYVVQQDFVHIQAPWVHVALGLLADYFEFLTIVTPSLLLRYRKKLPLQAVQDALQIVKDGNVKDHTRSIDVLIDRISPIADREAIATLELLKSAIYNQGGDGDQARAIWNRVSQAYGDIDDKFFKARVRKLGEDLGVRARSA